ncbi:MAG: hypothetical protein ABSC41_17510 [Acidimicrobiales bacterium]|jgi:hypothetical protein
MVPIAMLIATAGLLLSTLTATPGSAATIPSGATTTHGINVYVEENGEPASAWLTDARNEMKGIKSLHANAVAIAFPFYTTSLKANCVYAYTANKCTGPTSASPSPARLAVLIHAAQQAGLHVLLRPLMDETNLSPDWRGDIEPSNRTAWFASYVNMMAPYLSMAKSNKVTGFTISLELASLATASQWPSVIAWAKRAYPGQLVFAASWRASPNGGKGEVHAGTSVGVDSYPGLTKSTPSWTVAQLLSGWNSFLTSHKYGTADTNVTIDEVGIEAVDGAYKTPYIAVNGKFNPSIQANWFKAACDFYKAHKQSGIYFWGPNFTYNFGNLMTSPDSSQPEQLQPPTQAGIKACFA